MTAAPRPLPRSNRGNLVTGFVLSGALAIVACTALAFGCLLSAVFGNTQAGTFLAAMCLVALVGMGITQWLYIIPLGIYYLRKRQTRTASGLLIGALLVTLLNLLVWMSLGRLHSRQPF